ncbi:Neuron-specific calcium-binding protein hippocalcin [Paragonimus heterotremus]|uniref:Neuron-specific calcium-binding protein hippocalcin n=1 Tax=Paragonimus heterotremus TaxID=100268 RepID=A0A8J4TJN7_9TREM|nr:Neuron-specific calcium-binding protein hippocalcin [Paragonimus heterotremus]
MGQKQAKLRQEIVDELISQTAFTESEVQDWYKGFLKDCPTGQLTLEELKQIYSKFFPYGEPSRFAEHVFRSFDRNHDGIIDFREFLYTISVTSRGDLNAKLRWAFAIYDLDSDGFISRQDLCDVLASVYALIGSTIKLPEDEATPERRADKIFSQMDADHDGRLSFAEFADGLKSDKLLFQLLTMNVHSGSTICQPDNVEAISNGIPEQPVLIGEMNSLLEDGSRNSSTPCTNMVANNELVAS